MWLFIYIYIYISSYIVHQLQKFRATHPPLFRHVHKIAKSDYQLHHLCPSFCPSVCSVFPSVCLSVRPSVRRSVCWLVCSSVLMEQVWSQGTNFHGICYLRIFRKSVEEMQVSSKSDKTNGTVHEDRQTILILSRLILFRMSNVSENQIQRKSQHKFCVSNFFFSRKSCHV